MKAHRGIVLTLTERVGRAIDDAFTSTQADEEATVQQQTDNWWDILDQLMPKPWEYGVTRILLHSAPGTGKSSWPARNFKTDVHRIPLTEDSGPEELMGNYILEGGDTRFVEGPAPVAMEDGEPLVLDEIDRASSAVGSILHAILDDPDIAELHLPDGRRVTPNEGYIVFATMNGNPGWLDQPILDRFDLVIAARQPHPGILQHLDDPLEQAVRQHYDNLEVDEWEAGVTSRTAQSFMRLRDALGEETAARCVWGPKGKEVLSVLASHG